MLCRAKPYEGDAPYLFFSYCRQDAEQVYPIIEQLAKNGYRVWYDNGIHPGDNWLEVIAGHLSGSACFLAALTPRACNSHNCRSEMNLATELKVPVVSILMEDFELSPAIRLLIGSSQYIKTFQYPTMPEFYRALYTAQALSACLGPVTDDWQHPQPPQLPEIPHEATPEALWAAQQEKLWAAQQAQREQEAQSSQPQSTGLQDEQEALMRRLREAEARERQLLEQEAALRQQQEQQLLLQKELEAQLQRSEQARLEKMRQLQEAEQLRKAQEQTLQAQREQQLLLQQQEFEEKLRKAQQEQKEKLEAAQAAQLQREAEEQELLSRYQQLSQRLSQAEKARTEQQAQLDAMREAARNQYAEDAALRQALEEQLRDAERSYRELQQAQEAALQQNAEGAAQRQALEAQLQTAEQAFRRLQQAQEAALQQSAEDAIQRQALEQQLQNAELSYRQQLQAIRQEARSTPVRQEADSPAADTTSGSSPKASEEKKQPPTAPAAVRAVLVHLDSLRYFPVTDAHNYICLEQQGDKLSIHLQDEASGSLAQIICSRYDLYFQAVDFSREVSLDGKHLHKGERIRLGNTALIRLGDTELVYLSGADSARLRKTGQLNMLSQKGSDEFILMSSAQGKLIGRDQRLTRYVIQDITVSSNHARVWLANDKVFVADQGSTNGTYLDGHKLESGRSYLLRPGAKLEIGSLEFTCSRLFLKEGAETI